MCAKFPSGKYVCQCPCAFIIVIINAHEARHSHVPPVFFRTLGAYLEGTSPPRSVLGADAAKRRDLRTAHRAQSVQWKQGEPTLLPPSTSAPASRCAKATKRPETPRLGRCGEAHQISCRYPLCSLFRIGVPGPLSPRGREGRGAVQTKGHKPIIPQATQRARGRQGPKQGKWSPIN